MFKDLSKGLLAGIVIHLLEKVTVSVYSTAQNRVSQVLLARRTDGQVFGDRSDGVGAGDWPHQRWCGAIPREGCSSCCHGPWKPKRLSFWSWAWPTSQSVVLRFMRP